MRVGVHRHADLAVPEHFHDGAGRDTLSQEERRASVPQVVQTEPVQASFGPQLVPAPVDIPRLDRRSDRRGEDESVFPSEDFLNRFKA